VDRLIAARRRAARPCAALHRRGGGLLLAVGLGALAGCGAEKADPNDGTAGEDTGEAAEVEALRAVLTRGSLDLRGVRPSPEELLAVETEAELEAALAAWQAGPALGGRIAALWAPTWDTMADGYLPAVESFGPYEDSALLRSLGQQPTQVLARIVDEDQPWSAVVTGGWTVVDPLLEGLLPVALDEAGAEGWRRATWTDGRPPFGAFASPGVMLRYTSTEFNAQRSRANVLTRIALCDDFLDREVELGDGATILDQEAAISAVRDDPGCRSCHDTLDPIAAHFWGYFQLFDRSPAEYLRYHAAREYFWETWGGGVGPAFEGQASATAGDLGPAVAASPLFSACAVEQARALLLLDPVAAQDPEAAEADRVSFVESGLQMRALVASVQRDPRWRGVGDPAAGDASRRLLVGERMEHAMSALVGAELRVDAWGLTDNDRAGLRTLAGRDDLHSLAVGAAVPGPTQVLVQEALAEAVAGLATADDPMGTLFSPEDLQADPDEAAFARVHGRLTLAALSRPATAEERAADRALYDAARAAGASPAEAWRAVLTALLQDPAAVWG
jgi:hypothetical protein